jgi:hypothetical protein
MISCNSALQLADSSNLLTTGLCNTRTSEERRHRVQVFWGEKIGAWPRKIECRRGVQTTKGGCKGKAAPTCSIVSFVAGPTSSSSSEEAQINRVAWFGIRIFPESSFLRYKTRSHYENAASVADGAGGKIRGLAGQAPDRQTDRQTDRRLTLRLVFRWARCNQSTLKR